MIRRAILRTAALTHWRHWHTKPAAPANDSVPARLIAAGWNVPYDPVRAKFEAECG